MGTSISAGTIMAYMDLDMSSFNSAIDMTASSSPASPPVVWRARWVPSARRLKRRESADAGRYCAIDDGGGRGDSNRHAI